MDFFLSFLLALLLKNKNKNPLVPHFSPHSFQYHMHHQALYRHCRGMGGSQVQSVGQVHLVLTERMKRKISERVKVKSIHLNDMKIIHN